MVILTFIGRGVKVVWAVAVAAACSSALGQTAFIRINQAGYLPDDRKSAVVISQVELHGGFSVMDESRGGRLVLKGKLIDIPSDNWGGKFGFYYSADVSRLRTSGSYRLRLDNDKTISSQLKI